MTTKRISIKFCGGCNPRIDRGRVAQTVKNTLNELGYDIVYNELENIDFIIYISGCAVSCANKDGITGIPSIVVAGKTINLMPAEESELANKITSKVRDTFE